MGGFAWVTLATTDSYSLGALVLAYSLRRVRTHHDLAVLITPGVTESMREKLASVFTLVREVNLLDSKDETNLVVLQRPELGITFTKLHCWRLTQYEKCIFLDADTLVVRNCDELFEREQLSAAPDVGWPDCFNSGVFVFRPSQETFASLITFAASKGSFDGADQGLLNMYFRDWAHKDISKHLPFIYNMCSTATYFYAPAFKQYGENVRIIHFIGATKPWLLYFDTVTGIVQPPPGCDYLQPLLQIWWNIFCDNVHPQLTDTMASHQENFSFENEMNQELMENHHTTQRLALQQGSMDESETISKSLSENDNRLSTYCAFISRTYNQVEDHNHHIDHENSYTDHPIDNSINKKFDSFIFELRIPMATDLLYSRKIYNKNIYYDKVHTDLHILNSSQIPDPCKDPNKVGTQSELNVSPYIENINGGLAGALSKLTMGESRTYEQQAIEDHMRKQSWEQGHIDFMGRDSFDNILKKINETLAAVPAMEASSTKKIEKLHVSSSKRSEMKPVNEGVLPRDQKELNVTQGSSGTYLKLSSLEVTLPAINQKRQELEYSTDLINKVDCLNVEQISTSEKLNIQHPIDIKIIDQETVTIPELSMQLIFNTKETEIIASEPPKEIKIPEEVIGSLGTVSSRNKISENIVEIPLNSTIVSIADSDRVVSEIMSECPVPIQVAESVLQAESKESVESVSEHSRSVVEAVVSSTISQTEEFPVVVAETLIESVTIVPTDSITQLQQLDGHTNSYLQGLEQNIQLMKSNNEEIQLQSQVEVISSAPQMEIISLPSISEKKFDILPTQSINLTMKPKIESSAEVSFESQEKISLCLGNTPTTKTEEYPLRPNRSKEIKIPSTPIITEPTPPISPPFEINLTQIVQKKIQEQVPLESKEQNKVVSQQESSVELEQYLDSRKIQAESSTETLGKTESKKQPEDHQTDKKIVKNIMKKSSAESETRSSSEVEDTSKKIGKKVVKKEAKQLKEVEEVQSNSSIDKQKKGVKSVKKVMKISSSTNLDTEKSVLEIPPPTTSSEVPVPPKRKSKNTSNTGLIDKKPDKS